MLILNVKLGDEVILTTPTGERIVVKVTNCNGSRSLLGFTAPATVTIHRREVQERIDAEAKQR